MFLEDSRFVYRQLDLDLGLPSPSKVRSKTKKILEFKKKDSNQLGRSPSEERTNCVVNLDRSRNQFFYSGQLESLENLKNQFDKFCSKAYWNVSKDVLTSFDVCLEVEKSHCWLIYECDRFIPAIVIKNIQIQNTSLVEFVVYGIVYHLIPYIREKNPFSCIMLENRYKAIQSFCVADDWSSYTLDDYYYDVKF